MNLRKLPAMMVAVPALATWLGCSFDVGVIPVHPDAVDAGIDADASENDGADAEAGDAQQGDEPQGPVLTFKDDFQREDGNADGALWKDSGPGTPTIWFGQLCLETDEKVTAKIEPGAHGYLRVATRVSGGFELHLVGDAGDFLVLQWFDNGALGTLGGLDVLASGANSVRSVEVELDYTAQLARVRLDDFPVKTVPFESVVPVTRLHSLVFVDQFKAQPGFEWSGPTMCFDNVFVAASRPESDPFRGVPSINECGPGFSPITDCVARHCCSDYRRCNDEYDDCSNDIECMYSCVLEDATGTVGLCTEYNCGVTEPLAVALGECVDMYCSRDKLEEDP